MPSLVQVAGAVTAALLVATVATPSASANPVAGFGNVFGGARGTQEPAPEDSGSNPRSGGGLSDVLTFPRPAIGALFQRDPPRPHHHDVTPKAGQPAAATAAPATATTPAAPARTTAAAPTTAAPTTAASNTANTPTSTSAPTTTGGPTEATSKAPISDVCRDNWIATTNETVNANLDILTVLLDNGGFPGQLNGRIKWERNATDSQPDRWTYFWGDTDYKTYIRVERGEIVSRTQPVLGANPESLTGEVYWQPEDFCGKLRHAKYTQDPELRATNQPEVCFIEGDRVICWTDPACVEPLQPGSTCPRGGVSGALMASLVG